MKKYLYTNGCYRLKFVHSEFKNLAQQIKILDLFYKFRAFFKGLGIHKFYNRAKLSSSVLIFAKASASFLRSLAITCAGALFTKRSLPNLP